MVSDAIAVLLIGGDVEPVVVTRSGWLPIGQKAVATKTAGATVLEINGQPAIAYLRRYVSASPGASRAASSSSAAQVGS